MNRNIWRIAGVYMAAALLSGCGGESAPSMELIVEQANLAARSGLKTSEKRDPTTRRYTPFERIADLKVSKVYCQKYTAIDTDRYFTCEIAYEVTYESLSQGTSGAPEKRVAQRKDKVSIQKTHNGEWK